MAPLAVAFLASAAIKMYGTVQANRAKRKSLLHKEAMYNKQADEMQRRATENYAIMQEQGIKAVQEIRHTQTSLHGSASNTTKQGLAMGAYRNLYQEIARQKKVDDFQIAMTRLNGNIAGGEASEVNRQTALQVIGMGLDTYTTGKTNGSFSKGTAGSNR